MQKRGLQPEEVYMLDIGANLGWGPRARGGGQGGGAPDLTSCNVLHVPAAHLWARQQFWRRRRLATAEPCTACSSMPPCPGARVCMLLHRRDRLCLPRLCRPSACLPSPCSWHGLVAAVAGYRVLAFEPMEGNLGALRRTLCETPALLQRYTLVPKVGWLGGRPPPRRLRQAPPQPRLLGGCLLPTLHAARRA